MSFSDLFPSVPEWDGDTLRKFLMEHHASDYQLLDFRDKKEFEQQHLPSALLVPLANLQQCIKQLDSKKPTVVYCRNGIRSHAAAQVMIRAGFKGIYLLKGGILGWSSEVASSYPSHLANSLASLDTAEEHALFAWQMEENTHFLYDTIAQKVTEQRVATIFAVLAKEELQHEAAIKAIWEGLVGRAAPDDFPQRLHSYQKHDFIEGGMSLKDVMEWVKETTIKSLVDFAMALEVNAYDHYLTLHRKSADENSSRVFELISDEELRHLKLLSQFIEDFRSPVIQV